MTSVPVPPVTPPPIEVPDGGLFDAAYRAAGWTPPSVTPPPAPPTPVVSTVPFAAASPWNTPIPAGAVFQNPAILATTTGKTVRQWSAASMITLAWGTAADPETTIRLPAGWGWPAETIIMRVPAGTVAPGTSDNTICFVDTTTGLVVDLWQAAKGADGSWSGSSAAQCTLTSSGWGAAGKAAGVRAAGCSNLGGLVTSQDIANGAINHALAIVLPPEMIAAGFRAPAMSTDAGSTTGVVQVGQRLAIPPSTPKPKLATTQGSLLWDAMVKYGAFCVDHCGGEDPIFQFATSAPLQPNLAWPLPCDVNVIGAATRVIQ